VLASAIVVFLVLVTADGAFGHLIVPSPGALTAAVRMMTLGLIGIVTFLGLGRAEPRPLCGRPEDRKRA
jgi:hypothetical protein